MPGAALVLIVVDRRNLISKIVLDRLLYYLVATLEVGLVLVLFVAAQAGTEVVEGAEVVADIV